MNNIASIKHRVKAISLIAIFFFTSIYAISLMSISNSSLSYMKERNNNDDLDNEKNLTDNPKTSVTGTHIWWDKSFHSRQVINITNPYSVGFENFGVSISFNYSTLVNLGNMNSSLKDIRVIEYDSEGNPYQKKYYFEKNYPIDGNVTVWFNTNISAGTSEMDTYLYYGNDNIEINTTYFMNETADGVSNNFGWIRNGNFELDIKVGKNINDVFGWYYADDAPSDLTTVTPSIQDINTYQHNLSDTYDGQEHIPQGNYAFKFGDVAHTVSGGGSGDDIMGTLYSSPFVVPDVSGGDIAIRVWRNPRVYDGQNNKKFYYRARICDAFSSSNIDLHNEISIIEEWVTTKNSPETQLDDNIGSLPSVNTAGDGLMNYFIFEIPSQYKGKAIFIEFVVYVVDQEYSGFASFLQVDNVSFNYTLQVDLDPEVERRKSDISIIVRDVDGRIVPNAEVSLINNSKPIAEQILYGPINSSTEEGIALFSGVIYKNYNITVSYTIPDTNYETVVYNGSTTGNGYDIEEAQHIYTVEIDIWTIDFEFVDYGKESLNYGYVAIYNNTKGATNLANLTLDSNGKATFRWRNQSSYYYEVYYDNIDYNLNPTLLNESWIKRDNYIKLDDKIQKHSVFLNGTIPKNAPTFTVEETFYTNGSQTELSNKKILSAKLNVTAPKGSTTITSISIYYIDKNNYTNDNYRVYYNNTAGKDLYRIQIDMRSPPETPSTLAGDKYEVYGLKIVTTGTNSSKVWGVINITLFETCNIYNVTDLCKMYIRVVDSAGNGFVGPIVIVNSSINGQNFYVNLTTKFSAISYLNGYAYSKTNDQIPLWYLRGYEYNISLYWSDEERKLNVTYVDPYQWSGDQWRDYYNYTLNQKSNISIECNTGGVDPNYFQLKLDDLEVVDAVTWGDNFSVQVNFSKTDDNWVNSEPVSPPSTVTCHIKSTGPYSAIVREKRMMSLGNGIYNVTFNSSRLSAGGNGELYVIIISGIKENWGVGYAANITDSIFIDAVQTYLTMHDYYDSLRIISETSAIFGEFVNLTFSFYNNSNYRLEDAAMTYKWLGINPIQFYEDPVYNGYYTATIDTSLAEVWGSRSFEIVASLENYTTQTLLISLSITERPTTLNGESELTYINSKVWVEDPNPFGFIYQDSIIEDNIGNLTTATYTWEQLYPNGTRILGVFGSGFLVQNGDNTYTLDFRTELRSIGFYYLYVTLHKQNYHAKSALINLEIMSRVFNYTLPTGKIVDKILTIRNGEPLDLDIVLHDLTRDIPLQNAIISMIFQNKNYTFSEGENGSYSVNIIDYTRLTEDEISTTSTTSIIISKVNFTTQIVDTIIYLQNRIFNISISRPFKDNLIKIISGDRLSFTITLIDSYDDSLITDGTITFFIGGELYDDITTDNNGDGTYTITFLSYPEAFSSSKTLSGEILIQKTNFKSERIPITIEIKMTEIFPGMPTFYFILIVISIIGILGSIIAYRVIQQARIPKHVKKIRKVKGLIKSKKKITEIVTIPTKPEMLVKLFGNDWKQISLSIEKTLGIEGSKKKLPTKDKMTERRGDVK